jgi:hypothetical protein
MQAHEIDEDIDEEDEHHTNSDIDEEIKEDEGTFDYDFEQQEGNQKLLTNFSLLDELHDPM